VKFCSRGRGRRRWLRRCARRRTASRVLMSDASVRVSFCFCDDWRGLKRRQQSDTQNDEILLFDIRLHLIVRAKLPIALPLLPSLLLTVHLQLHQKVSAT
jgi:hypothetical protein